MTDLIDICCNFAHESFREDETEVLARAAQAGVSHMLVPGSSVADSVAGIALATRYPQTLSAAVGVHPHHAVQWTIDSAPALRALAQDPAVRAIGECGLDYNRNFSEPLAQRQAFAAQLELACELGLPVFLHEREAHGDFVEILAPRRGRLAGGVAHCFTGSEQELRRYLELDLYIGITGWICDERRGTHLKALLGLIPPDRLLIETDAPYLLPRSLRPQPRNRRNEPAFLPHVLETIAASLGRTPAELAQTTRANARRLFGIGD